jgi:hypothetical protein
MLKQKLCYFSSRVINKCLLCCVTVKTGKILKFSIQLQLVYFIQIIIVFITVDANFFFIIEVCI